jgi:hypothetical protein
MDNDNLIANLHRLVRVGFVSMRYVDGVAMFALVPDA